MASFLQELKEENAKSGLFEEHDTGVSYPTGFPILDQQLGFIQEIKKPNGDAVQQVRLGLTGGTINMFVGPSSSGKTAGAIQAANTITEPYGEDASCILVDAEKSSGSQRVLDVTGLEVDEYNKRWSIIDDPANMTFSGILEITKKLAEKKESNKQRYLYNTGFLDINGEEIVYYKPTVMVIDSLMKIVADDKDYEEIPGLTSSGRDAIFRGKWLRSMLAYTGKYNIIVIIINHLGNAIELQPGKGGAKQLTFIPTGKNIPGGEKVVYYSSTIIVWQPINSKDQIKTEDINGYNGVSVKAAVCKSRSGPGGVTATLEFVQESGFDIILTLMQLAKEKELIKGRNPGCYFENEPDVKFDTRIFVKELEERPELAYTLMMACKPVLFSMIRKSASIDKKKMETKRNIRSNYINLLK